MQLLVKAFHGERIYVLSFEAGYHMGLCSYVVYCKIIYGLKFLNGHLLKLNKSVQCIQLDVFIYSSLDKNE